MLNNMVMHVAKIHLSETFQNLNRALVFQK